MKSTLFGLLLAFSVGAFAQEDHTIRIGLYLGSQGGHAKFSGGMSEANARFNHNDFGGGSIGINGRYDFNKHWMITAGIGIHTIGFGYSIAENYSLIGKTRNNTSVNSEFAMLEIPAMGFYKFNPNCKNVRWLIGAGFSQDLTGASKIDKTESKANDGQTSVNYISSTSSTKGGMYWNLRWSVGREKTFKNKSILNASVLFNIGLNQVATSTVNYTIDNQTYMHTFTNDGNFIGLRLTYFFQPIAHTSAKNSKTISGK